MPISNRFPTETSDQTPNLIGEIRAAFHGIRRRWLWIVIATAVALAVAFLFLLLTTPRYQATAQILIDPRAKRIVEGAVVAGGYGSSAAGADTLLVDSQVELIQSSAVLKKIVESEQLHKDSEFAVPRSSGGVRMMLRNTIGRTLFGNEREIAPDTNEIDTTVWRLADKHLRVRRLGNTYVISVAVMSRDPAKAAKLANAIANAYISDQVRATGDTTREATTALQSRIVDLRKQVETAENAVETFRAKAGLLGVPNLLVTEQQLQQTNDKLILARSQTAIAKARFDQVKDLSARGGSALLSAQSDALKSAVIANLRASLSRVERREAIVQQTLRPGHPEYGSVQVEKRALMTQIEEELNRIKANARGEFELAQSNEKSLAGELKSLEGQTATGNQAQVRLRELQREAQAGKAIFEQFLNRSKETGEQESLGRENSRIISEATVPPYPTFPPTFLVLLGALLSGLMAGAGTAWLAHTFSSAPAAGTKPANAVSPPPAAAAGQPARSADTSPEHRPVSPRLRKMLAPMKQAENPIVPATPSATTASLVQPTPPRIVGGTSSLETLARLPALGKPDHSTEEPTFADHIAAVDDVTAAGHPGYREAIDHILADLSLSATRGKPLVTMLVGTGVAAGTSSTALALAYRAAVSGRRTLLVDVSAADAGLSHVFAANLKQRRACVLDSEAHLAEITLRDDRTGLSILPIALADLAHLDIEHQRRLVSGLRQIGRRFDLVILDAGSATANHAMAFLTAMVDKVLIVTARSSVSTGLTRLRAMETAQRFPTRASAPAIIEISAA